ncbi:hypothetical protein [Conexibacter arvalis]|uniref:Uncharacterized protein n=1 Tax=Conexibacter arvalis TaxID=912552 RepID=A0A840ICR7_9ACTN|nr:hypothetical protein [Conexibacter arvalis]MBB4662135.1 hypothetical protein [Conexibacter arvalis]
MADSPVGPVVPVLFDEHAIAEDLHHLPGGARVALETFQRDLNRSGGLQMARLKRCDAEGRDGTDLGGCLKTYVPWPTGRFGLVFVPAVHPSRPLALRVIAFGVRHPSGNRPSVYRIAHERKHGKR